MKNVYPDILLTELGKRVTLTDENSSLSDDFLISGIEHNIDVRRGVEHKTTYSVEKFVSTPFLIVDDENRYTSTQPPIVTIPGAGAHPNLSRIGDENNPDANLDRVVGF